MVTPGFLTTLEIYFAFASINCRMSQKKITNNSKQYADNVAKYFLKLKLSFILFDVKTHKIKFF